MKEGLGHDLALESNNGIQQHHDLGPSSIKPFTEDPQPEDVWLTSNNPMHRLLGHEKNSIIYIDSHITYLCLLVSASLK